MWPVAPLEAPRMADREEFYELDCLRGIAMCLVFGIHADGIVRWLQAVPADASLWRSFIYGGHTAPTLFFVLSAFLLSRPFLSELRGGRRVNVENYFVRRALRIMPLYVVAVLVAILCTAPTTTEALHALPYLAFANAIPGTVAPMDPFSGPWWTVCTEVEFYLALPLLALAARTRRGRIAAVAFLLVYAAVYVALALGAFGLSDVMRYALSHSALGRGPSFLAGILAAVVYDRWGAAVRGWGARHGRVARLTGDVLVVGGVLAIGALLQWRVTSATYLDSETAWPLWRIPESLLWAAVMLLLVTVPMHLKPLFANRVWARLGVLSYSIYLIHTPVLLYGREATNAWFPDTLQGWTPGSAIAVGIMAAFSLWLAKHTYRWIEEPFIRQKTSVPVLAPSLGAATPVSVVPIPGAARPAEARLHHTPHPPEDL
jgi:peptidoglycan/LPS O-acetylase OafA/YrhL